MNFKFEYSFGKMLIGTFLNMSFAENNTNLLWKSFMPQRHKITNRINNSLISLQIYPDNFFENLDPLMKFDKWAAAEVDSFAFIPDGMHPLIVPPGKYAVFDYIGKPEDGPILFSWIFNEWMPVNGFVTDNRPHFEVLGEKYKNGSPDSEEEIWIPIREN